jgi:resolvase-like protein
MLRRDGSTLIVVYKVDRLTRWLADFAKLVETFDANSVSFVSVTQSFNTTTSMGRLTLNLLLSFAQFEREVTGERAPTSSKVSQSQNCKPIDNYRRYPVSHFCMYHTTGKDSPSAAGSTQARREAANPPGGVMAKQQDASRVGEASVPPTPSSSERETPQSNGYANAVESASG